MGILKAAVISIATLNSHVIDNLKCTQSFTTIPTIMALEANGLIGRDTMEMWDGIVAFTIKGDWNLGPLPVKQIRLRFTDDLHQELLPELFDPDTPGTLPPERYEFYLEATVEEVTNWYEETIDTIDLQPIFIFDQTDRLKKRWPEAKAITSLACTPNF